MIRMKKLVFVLFLICCCVVVSAQVEEKNLVTEVQIAEQDSLYRYLYLYNELDKKILQTKYVFIDDNWKGREQIEWIYNKNKCIEKQYRKWNGYEWILTYQINYEYQGDLVSSEVHSNLVDGVVIPKSKIVNTIKNGRIVLAVEYNRKNNAWLTRQKSEYFYENTLLDSLKLTYYIDNLPTYKVKNIFDYNELGKMTKMYQYLWTDNSWVNDLKLTCYYNSENTQKQAERLKKWDKAEKVWINEQHIDYRYDEQNRLIEESYQSWSDLFWKNNMKYTYDYNSNNQLVRKTSYLSIYKDFRKIGVVYYSDFKYGKASLVEAKYDFWGGEKGNYYTTFLPYQLNDEVKVVNASKISINYVPVDKTTVLNIDDEKRNKINIYPNPSPDGIFYFDTNLNQIERWEVFGLDGKMLNKEQGNGRSGVIDLSNSPAGIYIIRIFTKRDVQIQKLIIE